MERFNASISFDKRLADVDVRGSISYARALARCGVLTGQEAADIVAGLETVRGEWSSGLFEIRDGDEVRGAPRRHRVGVSLLTRAATGHPHGERAAPDGAHRRGGGQAAHGPQVRVARGAAVPQLPHAWLLGAAATTRR